MAEVLVDLEQRSEEWHQVRLGKVTASRIADLTAKTRSGWGASRKNYMAQLTAERLTGIPASTFTNAAMQLGTDTEPFAREAYEIATGELVEEVGFVLHPDIEHSGASPDGLVGDLGMLEIKAPNTATHIETLLTQKVDKRYMVQMYWQMACTGRQWVDFVSFDPRMPQDLQMWVTRIERDDAQIAELETMVREFLEELNAQVEKLEALRS